MQRIINAIGILTLQGKAIRKCYFDSLLSTHF